MGGACSTHGEDEKCIQISGEEPEGRRHSENLGVDGRLGLNGALRNRVGSC
jgi:hypothetical protein